MAMSAITIIVVVLAICALCFAGYWFLYYLVEVLPASRKQKDAELHPSGLPQHHHQQQQRQHDVEAPLIPHHHAASLNATNEQPMMRSVNNNEEAHNSPEASNPDPSVISAQLERRLEAITYSSTAAGNEKGEGRFESSSMTSAVVGFSGRINNAAHQHDGSARHSETDERGLTMMMIDNKTVMMVKQELGTASWEPSRSLPTVASAPTLADEQHVEHRQQQQLVPEASEQLLRMRADGVQDESIISLIQASLGSHVEENGNDGPASSNASMHLPTQQKQFAAELADAVAKRALARAHRESRTVDLTSIMTPAAALMDVETNVVQLLTSSILHSEEEQQAKSLGAVLIDEITAKSRQGPEGQELPAAPVTISEVEPSVIEADGNNEKCIQGAAVAEDGLLDGSAGFVSPTVAVPIMVDVKVEANSAAAVESHLLDDSDENDEAVHFAATLRIAKRETSSSISDVKDSCSNKAHDGPSEAAV